ncbi:MAG: SDR family NAD(P)-dependent oxidoreductase [Patescibacteria group bacterium]|nr:SDR family NAD(P)-dependent oxidoreductase [Patescibacteria group bacterium]
MQKNNITKVLVTGGAGFIGMAVARNLVSKGIQVTILDRNPKEGTQQFPAGNGAVNVFYGDVRDATAVLEAVQHNEGVIHLAAMLGTQETIDNPGPVAEVNVLGSINVFNAVRQFKRKAVYIAVGNHWMNNPYSITKTTAERFALMMNKESDAKIAIVRGMNVFGPGQKNAPVRKMMPNFIINALKNEDIIVYGNGEQVMDWIYVDDIAEILVRALLNDHGNYTKIFEAGLCEDLTVIGVAKKIIEMTGSKSKIINKPMRRGEIPDSKVKTDESTWNLELLDWKKDNMVSFEEGLKNTIDYYKKNIDKYEINTLFV